MIPQFLIKGFSPKADLLPPSASPRDSKHAGKMGKPNQDKKKKKERGREGILEIYCDPPTPQISGETFHYDNC